MLITAKKWSENHKSKCTPQRGAAPDRTRPLGGRRTAREHLDHLERARRGRRRLQRPRRGLISGEVRCSDAPTPSACSSCRSAACCRPRRLAPCRRRTRRSTASGERPAALNQLGDLAEGLDDRPRSETSYRASRRKGALRQRRRAATALCRPPCLGSQLPDALRRLFAARSSAGAQAQSVALARFSRPKRRPIDVTCFPVSTRQPYSPIN